MNVDLDIIEQEYLIGKLKYLELQNRISPFKNTSEPNLERRIAQALNNIPEEYRLAAMALFGNVIYFSNNILTDIWKYLWSVLRGKYECGIEDVLLLELDRDQLRDDFYRANLIPGRLEDNIPWRSTHDIIDTLIHLEKTDDADFLRESFLKIINKKIWVLLVDLSISGSSVSSEIERIKKVIDFLTVENKPKLIALIQIITDDAVCKFESVDFEYIYGINVSSNCALNSQDYNLLKNGQLKEQAIQLCEWFAESFIIPSNYRLAKLAKEKDEKEIAYFGFDQRGWNIVTYKNTPNNSLPILWFRPEDDSYIPPFERIDSRIGKSWEGRRKFIQKIESDPGFGANLKSILNLQ